jgi:hypothetical protein
MLMHECPVGALQTAQFRFGQFVYGNFRFALPVADLAGVRFDQTGDGAQQRGLARAAFADDAEHFARPQVKRDAATGNGLAEALLETRTLRRGALILQPRC